MKLFEIMLTSQETLMINLEHITTVKELPDSVMLTMLSGERLNVTPQTIMTALNAAEVGYFKFTQPEEETTAE